MAFDKSKQVARQGSMYLAVGGFTALLELALFQLLYGLGVLGVAPSNIVAVTVSTGVNFVLNGRVTFKSAQHPAKSLVKYLLLFAFNTCFSTLVISWSVSMGCPSVVAKVGTMCCIVCWNFVLYRRFVFS